MCQGVTPSLVDILVRFADFMQWQFFFGQISTITSNIYRNVEENQVPCFSPPIIAAWIWRIGSIPGRKQKILRSFRKWPLREAISGSFRVFSAFFPALYPLLSRPNGPCFLTYGAKYPAVQYAYTRILEQSSHLLHVLLLGVPNRGFLSILRNCGNPTSRDCFKIWKGRNFKTIQWLAIIAPDVLYRKIIFIVI